MLLDHFVEDDKIVDRLVLIDRDPQWIRIERRALTEHHWVSPQLICSWLIKESKKDEKIN